MYLNRLPKELLEAVKLFARHNDPFQQIIKEDKVLDELEDQEIDRAFERDCFLTLQGQPLKICGHYFKPLTATAVFRLWASDNPLLTNSSDNMTIDHLDEFFSLLEYPEAEVAKNFMSANYIDLFEGDKLNTVIERIMKIAFFPLSLFPQVNAQMKTSTSVAFDCDWLMRLVAIASSAGNIRYDEAMKLPLYSLCSLYVQYARMNGTKDLHRTPPEEIIKQKVYRVCELIIDRLIELGLADKSKHDELVELIYTEPEKENG